jgi:HNH endonuclease
MNIRVVVKRVGKRGYTRRVTPTAKGVARILAKVVKPDGDGGCWLFTGFIDADGYGKICLNKRQQRPHRVMCEHYHGKSDRPFVRHKCDVRNCVNPAHLEWGTPKENTRDMVDRGRHLGRPKGSKNPHGRENSTLSKLSPAVVDEMRRLARHGGMSQAAIGKLYGVSQTVAGDAICGHTYRDATEPPLPRRGWGPGKAKAR